MRALSITVVLLAASTAAQASTIRVPGDYSTIQAAINAAYDGDVVLVSAGTYVENIDFSGKAVSVTSELGPEFTTIRSANSYASTVVFADAEPIGAELSGFTVTGGGLGGIRCYHSSPTITNNVITGNSCYDHHNGAGITMEGTSNSLIRGNVFRGNHSQGYGGSILFKFGSSDDEVSYNLMYDNVGYGEIRVTEATNNLRIINNTIVPTTYTGITHQGTGTMILRNNIIVNAPYYAVRDDSNTGQIRYTCTYNNNHGGADFPYAVDATNFRADPMFENLAGRNFQLLPESPCINAGDPDPTYNDPDGTRNDLGGLPSSSLLPSVSAITLAGELLQHVIGHQPVISWSYFDSPVSSPAGYEIEIGVDDNWDIAEMWESGQVMSASQFATYAGAALEDGANYWGRIRAFNGVTWGGWRPFSFHMNDAPDAPELRSPVSGVQTNAANTRLEVTNSPDLDNETITYDFEVYTDPGLADLLAELTGVPEGEVTTRSPAVPGLSVESDYWWRARAHDGYEYSDWSGTETFHTRNSVILLVPEDHSTIQAAMLVAGPGDEVRVGPGTYTGLITVQVPGVVLRSSEGADATILVDGGGQDGILLIDCDELPTTVLQGFTFQASYDESALRIAGGASARVTECIFTGNRAANGAGINCRGTNVLIDNCRFDNNVAGSEGGGIFIRGTSITVENCEFHDNVGSASGGAVYVQLSTGVILRNNLVYENSAGGMGGGFVYAYSSSNVSIVNNTVVANRASDRGAGITIYGGSVHDLRNNIVAFNTEAAGVYAAVFNPIVEYNDVFGNDEDYDGVLPGTGSISEDPQFADPAVRDYTLMSSSPCIDAGDPDPQYNDPDGTRNDMGSGVRWIKLPTAQSLRVQDEDMSHVLGNTPLFTWRYFSNDGSTQQAYECQVGTNPSWDVAEMWSSGEQSSAQEAALYAGLPLEDGITYFVRVRLSNGTDWGEWRMAEFHLNAAPPAPALVSPVGGASVNSMMVQLVAGCVTDPENDPVSYDFELYANEGLTELVLARSVTGCLDHSVTTGPLDVTVVGSYWWRARVSDAYESSAWAGPATFTVTSVPEIRVPGQYPSIAAAITAASSGMRIVVSDGVYSGPNNRDLSFQGKLLQIVSENGPEQTIIDCGGSARAFYVHTGESNACLVRGFTIQNGNSTAGGALRIQGAALTVRDCVFRNNQAPHGGAVYINTPTANCFFTDCRFEGNDARGDAKDLADGIGGALYAQYGSATIEMVRCVFVDNVADMGGALAWSEHRCRIDGCTIVDNFVLSIGAAVAAWGDCDMSKSIVAFNRGADVVQLYSATDFAVSCTDIFGNEGGDWTGELAALAGLNGNFSANPEFCLPQMGQYSVRSTSPCVPENNTCHQLIGALDPTLCTIELPMADDVNLSGEVMDHVIATNPTFAWTTVDEPGSALVAHEVQVGTDNDWSLAEMWSSGPVFSEAQSANYAGAPLDRGVWYWFRIRLYNGVQWGSWVEHRFRRNSTPTVPTPVSPLDNQVVHFMNTILTVANSTDTEQDLLTYDFEIYRDHLLTDLVARWTAVTESPERTAVGPLEVLQTSSNYWWRARSNDGFAQSDWTAIHGFQTAERMTLRVPSQYPTIQAAVNASYRGDRVLIADGTYTGAGNRDIDLGGKTISVESENGAATTIIDCDKEGRGFFIHRGERVETLLKGLTIRNGNSAAGAGLRLQGASATVVDCIFEDNVAPHGGAVYANTAGTGSSFVNCVFRRNSALGDKNDKADGHGGAVYAQYGNTLLTFDQCLFTGNAADLGGALICREESGVRLKGSTVADNASETGSAAVIFGPLDNQELIRSIIAFNTGGSGAFAFCQAEYVSCTDIFGNDGGDWIGCLEDLIGTNGNFSADPRFCGFRSGNDDFRLRRRSLCLPEYSSCGALIGARGLGSECTDYLCGDANDDEILAYSDVVFLKNAYFGTGPLPRIHAAGDPNCDGFIMLNDMIYLIEYLRGRGPAPRCTYEEKPLPDLIVPGQTELPIVLPTFDSVTTLDAVSVETR